MKKLTILLFFVSAFGGLVFSQKLVITEIMYNDPSADVAGDSLEFIEFYNNDTVSVNLLDFTMSGVIYTFPDTTLNPDNYFLLCRNASKFQNFFGISALQWTSGNLLNTGESIILLSPAGDTIDIVTYAPSAPWPTAPNGNGHSLVLCDYNADNNDGTNWFASTNFVDTISGGEGVNASPGSSDAVCFDTIPPAIILAHASSQTLLKVLFTEAVEDTSSQNINNYSVDNGIGNPVTAVKDLTNPALVHLTFSSSFTEGILYTVIVTNVKDLKGNVMISDSATFTYKLPPKLVITEIMYDDPSDGAAGDSLEFIEFYNNDTVSVNLSGFTMSGVTYTFTDTILNPGDYFLLCRNAAKFQNFFGIPALQWTSNNLSNDGESVIFKNPIGDTIDIVTYALSASWPTAADGTGPSLVLCDYNADNNDGTNWFASTNFVDTISGGDSVFASPGGADSACITVYVNEFISENDIICYPNPSNDYIIIQVQSLEFGVQSSELRIYDLLGKEVIYEKLQTTNHKLQTTNWVAGVYLLKLSLKDKVFIKKLIVF